ncbi:MAG: hypothetical protein EPN86_02270 [Nanoarchaeota archaeon]|nr:MAG: hypothetical protein EPN86_02270 [Nanoarchaeota archaeon]
MLDEFEWLHKPELMKTFIIAFTAHSQMVRHLIRKARKNPAVFIGGAILVILLIVLVAYLVNQKSTGNRPDTVLATVNGEPITQGSIDKLYNRLDTQYKIPAAKGVLLNQSIDQMLLLQAATKNGITVSDQEVDNQFNDAMQKQNITLQQVEAQIALRNISMQDLKSELKVQLEVFELINETIITKVNATDSEIRQYYFFTTGQNESSNITISNSTKQQIRTLILDQKISDGVNALIIQLRGQASIIRLHDPK